MVYRRPAVRAGTLAVLLAISSAFGCSSLTDTTMTASSSLLEAAEAFPTPAPEATPDEQVMEPAVVPYWPAPDPFEGYDLPEGAESAADGVIAPPIADPTPEPAPASWTAGPPTVEANEILERAEAMLGIAYVWGGNTLEGLDCSAYVSRAWGLTRQTTDTLHLYSTQITKDELLPGDAMNLTKRVDPRGYGHVRLFAAWANDERTRMWVYEETPRESIYHVIAYDDRYVPLRRANFTSDVTVAPVVPAPAAAPRASRDNSDAFVPGSRRERNTSDAPTSRTGRSWTNPVAAISTPEATPALTALVSFVPESTYTPSSRTRRTRSWFAPVSTVAEAALPAPTAAPTPAVTPTPEPTGTPPPSNRTRRTWFSSAPTPTATEAPVPEPTAPPTMV
ncbi:MAG: NlpC/P60 family protein, partial [Dehalococcoidia bacterium]|nr:NlpC/P60 family protein [Dehalococcoidia bacterium]